MLVQCTHPSGLCIWGLKISAQVHYFVTIYSQKWIKSCIFQPPLYAVMSNPFSKWDGVYIYRRKHLEFVKIKTYLPRHLPTISNCSIDGWFIRNLVPKSVSFGHRSIRSSFNVFSCAWISSKKSSSTSSQSMKMTSWRLGSPSVRVLNPLMVNVWMFSIHTRFSFLHARNLLMPSFRDLSSSGGVVPALNLMWVRLCMLSEICRRMLLVMADSLIQLCRHKCSKLLNPLDITSKSLTRSNVIRDSERNLVQRLSCRNNSGEKDTCRSRTNSCRLGNGSFASPWSSFGGTTLPLSAQPLWIFNCTTLLGMSEKSTVLIPGAGKKSLWLKLLPKHSTSNFGQLSQRNCKMLLLTIHRFSVRSEPFMYVLRNFRACLSFLISGRSSSGIFVGASIFFCLLVSGFWYFWLRREEFGKTCRKSHMSTCLQMAPVFTTRFHLLHTLFHGKEEKKKDRCCVIHILKTYLIKKSCLNINLFQMKFSMKGNTERVITLIKVFNNKKDHQTNIEHNTIIEVRLYHTTPQLLCVAALHPPAQKLPCYCIVVSHKTLIHFNLKYGDAAVTCGRK